MRGECNNIHKSELAELNNEMLTNYGTPWIPPTTIWRRLADSIDFVVNYVHWVLYKLNDVQLAASVQMSNELLRVVRWAKHQDWHISLPLMSRSFICQ
jgi:hypothetical protein